MKEREREFPHVSADPMAGRRENSPDGNRRLLWSTARETLVSDKHTVISLVVESPEDTDWRLLWKTEDQEFCVHRSISGRIKKGRTRLRVRPVPGTCISQLRLDACAGDSFRTAFAIQKSPFAWLLAESPDNVPSTILDHLGRALRALIRAFPGRSQELHLRPAAGIERSAQGWRCTSADPQFLADEAPLVGPFTCVYIEAQIDAPKSFQIYWAGKGSFSEDNSLTLRMAGNGHQSAMRPLRLPLRTLRLRIDPGDKPGDIGLLRVRLFNHPFRPFFAAYNHVRCWALWQDHRLRFHYSKWMRKISSKRNQRKSNDTDIIIPIYNGMDVVPSCIQSVIRNSPPQGCRIILIDDSSTDPRIKQFLDSIAVLADDRISVLRNEKNLGFVGTVNRGMSLGDSHVVLLNSDTEVPPRWLERLHSTWHINRHGIGTVTAMSNNATICSFPRFCQDNELWGGATAIEIDTTFGALPATPVHLPTAVGFCMFISRECLDATGPFDEQSFGRGYGEENDFCVRAQRNGFASVAATNLFVYHKGSVSFAADSKPSLEKNYRILLRKWPFYENSVSSFISSDPLAPIRMQAAISLIARRLPSGKKIVIHFVTASLGGGTAKHIEELSAKTPDPWIPFVIRIDRSHVEIELPLSREKWTISFPERLAPDLLSYLKHALKPIIFHIHHVIHLDPVWLRAFQGGGIPYAFTAHDYYSACPSYTLINNAGKHCGGERRWSTCQRCISTNQHAERRHVSISSWRRTWGEFLKHAHVVFTPSDAASRILSGYYPAARIRVIPHGAEPLAASQPIPYHPPRANEPLVVACLGALGPNKGGDLVHQLAKYTRDNNLPIKIVVIGFTHIIPWAQDSPDGVLTTTGRYTQEELPGLVRRFKPHLVLHPTIWPETFSYTLSEAWSLGLPVLTSRLGATGERMAATRAGWILDDLTCEGIIQKLLALRADPSELMRAIGHLTRWKPQDNRRMAAEYLQHYESAQKTT